MAAQPSSLRLIPGGRDLAVRPAPRVVAEILEDGTLRTANGALPADDRAWNRTTISGPDWVIWLERRRWTSSVD